MNSREYPYACATYRTCNMDTRERWAKEVARVVYQSFGVAPYGFDVRISPDSRLDSATLATVPTGEAWPGDCILANVRGADFTDAFPYLSGGVDLTWHIAHHTSEAEFVTAAGPLLASRLELETGKTEPAAGYPEHSLA